MSTFELNFGLTSVILGLALTHMATALRKLLLRGRQVIWAPESVILVCLLMMLIVSIWMTQLSGYRGAFSDWVTLLNVLRMLMFYFAAGFSLPEPEPGEATIDLLAYYDRTRRFTFGSLAAGILVFWVYNSVTAPAGWRADLVSKAIPIALWVVLMFVRWRWLNLLVLALAFVGIAISEMTQASLGR